MDASKQAPSTAQPTTRSTFRAALVGEERISGSQALTKRYRDPVSARPETPPQPSIVMPRFARDGDFVERGTILKDL